jgi:hypothetical protein
MFWNNIAFFIATIAFLVINFSQTITGSSLEMIWLIYLGSVAGSHSMNKFLALKYKDVTPGVVTTTSVEQKVTSIPPTPPTVVTTETSTP